MTTGLMKAGVQKGGAEGQKKPEDIKGGWVKRDQADDITISDSECGGAQVDLFITAIQ